MFSFPPDRLTYVLQKTGCRDFVVTYSEAGFNVTHVLKCILPLNHEIEICMSRWLRYEVTANPKTIKKYCLKLLRSGQTSCEIPDGITARTRRFY